MNQDLVCEEIDVSYRMKIVNDDSIKKNKDELT